jgi:hypothetical protein
MTAMMTIYHRAPRQQALHRRYISSQNARAIPSYYRYNVISIEISSHHPDGTIGQVVKCVVR